MPYFANEARNSGANHRSLQALLPENQSPEIMNKITKKAAKVSAYFTLMLLGVWEIIHLINTPFGFEHLAPFVFFFALFALNHSIFTRNAVKEEARERAAEMILQKLAGIAGYKNPEMRENFERIIFENGIDKEFPELFNEEENEA